MVNNGEQELLDKLIDEIIKHCPEAVAFNCSNVLGEIKDLEDYNIPSDTIRSKLIDLGYAIKHGNYPILLTTFGREVKNFGGHIKYQEYQKEKAKKIINKEELEIEVLRTTIAQNKYLYKTRKWNYIASGLAIIISIIALIIDCSGE